MKGTWRVDGGDGDDDANETHDKLGGKSCVHNNVLFFIYPLGG